nr:hypothetical protein [Nocardia cyriacigeorgica]
MFNESEQTIARWLTKVAGALRRHDLPVSRWPVASRPPRIAATWPSIMPLVPSRSAPASAWAMAIST